MKHVFVIILSLAVHNLCAQISQTIDLQNQSEIRVDTEYAEVVIETWDNDYIALDGMVDINKNSNNEAFKYEIDKSSQAIKITTFIDEDKVEQRVISKSDDSKSVFFNSVFCSSSSKTTGSTMDIKLSIKVPRRMKIKVEGVYGPIKVIEPIQTTEVNNTYASVDVICSSDILPRMDIESIYAAVDVTLPANAKADLRMETSYGEMYTDFDYVVKGNKGNNPTFGSALRTELNGGGTRVSLSSGYANVYVRKM